MTGPEQITRLLQAWSLGESGALDDLTPLVYRELKRLAAGQMRNQAAGHTLQPTALVHEAYLRLAGSEKLSFANRSAFYALMVKAMRRILVDSGRAKQTAKRGAGVIEQDADEHVPATAQSREIIALDDALNALEALDPRRAAIIEMRYFGGMTGEEIAAALGVSTATVTREAALAEAWLKRELTRSPAER